MPWIGLNLGVTNENLNFILFNRREIIKKIYESSVTHFVDRITVIAFLMM